MNVNDVARVRMQFIVDGAYADPTTITMTVFPPAAPGMPDFPSYTVEYPDPALVKDDVGKYSGIVPIAGYAGRWRVECVSTGTAAGSSYVTFYAYE